MQVLFARHRSNIYRGQRDRRSQRPGEAPAVSAISVGLGVWSRSVGESAKLIPHSGRDYGPGTSRLRHDHARRPNCDTAIEGSAQGTSGAVWAEPQDSCQVA